MFYSVPIDYECYAYYARERDVRKSLRLLQSFQNHLVTLNT